MPNSVESYNLEWELVQEIVWPELKNFIEFMSGDFAVKNNDDMKRQIYFELKARVIYAEKLWNMFVCSLKRVSVPFSFSEAKKVDTSAYFKALGKAKMIISKYNTTESAEFPEVPESV